MVDPQTRIPYHDLAGRMVVHDAVAIARRHRERLDGRIVGCVQRRPNFGGSATLDEVDVQQWHGVDASGAVSGWE